MASLRFIVKLKAAAVRNRKLTLSTQQAKCSSFVIEDLLTIDKVRTLERIFTRFEREQKRCMDIYEFRAAMRQVLGSEHASKMIDDAFMKVDSNCDGTVSWDEYLSYIQLRYTEQDHKYYSANIRPFPGRCSKLVRRTEMNLRYVDSIIQVRYQPHTVKSLNNLYEAVASDKCGRYVHISQDGCVNLCNNDMDLTKSFRVEPPSDKLGAWFLDMVVLYNVRMIAVSTTYFEIRFYDIVASGFKLELTVKGFDSCATCMDYWVQEDKLSHAILVLGDLNGSIYALEFNDCPTICVLQPALPNLKRKYQHELDINDIEAGRVCGMTGYKLSNVHEKPVSMVKYIYDLRAFISCCSGDPERSVFFGDFQRRREPSIIQISRGVTCFDFCHAFTVIVCGSKDAIVRVYNPYIPNKPVMTFRQHRRPIIYVFANDVKEQVISVDCEKCVHVHDLNTQVCIQTVIRIRVPLPPRPITAAIFNVERQSLILCNNEIAVFEHREEELRNMQTRSTTCAITQLLYNDVFRQVVTGDVDGDVIIWDPVTGMRALQFTAYQSSTEWERKVDNSVTAMCFDETKRQLATGNAQGILRVWNFNNGALMRELTVVAHRDITCIIWIPNKILTAGWDRRIWMHLDYPEDRATVHQWERLHKDDITAMAFHAPNLLVTGSYDGEVLIWCINTREVISRINPTVSMRHQIPRSRFARSSQDTLNHSVVVASSTSTVAAPVTPSRNDFEPWETDTEKQEAHISLPGIGDRPLEVRHHLRKATEKSRRHPDDRISAVIRPLAMAESTSCVKSAPRRRTHRPNQFEHLISRNKQSIEKILFLVTRPTSPTVGSLVVANNFGWMRFWSFHLSGSLIGQYCAVHTVGESVCAIATDSLNRYLITGDTDGYVRVWDISNYALSEFRSSCSNEPRTSANPRFPFTRHPELVEQQWKLQYANEYPPQCTNPFVTYSYPPLMTSFRAHLQAVTDLQFIDNGGMIVSSSLDASLRLWRVRGQFIGIFDRKIPWSYAKQKPAATWWPNLKIRHTAEVLKKPDQEPKKPDQEPKRKASRKSPHDLEAAERKKREALAQAQAQAESADRERRHTKMANHIPADVRRRASATTLRVMQDGGVGRWKDMHRYVYVWYPFAKMLYGSNIPVDDRTREEVERDEVLKEFEAIIHDNSDINNMLPTRKRENILGKNFSCGRRHQPLPLLKEITHHPPTQYSVYQSLPCHTLFPVERCPRPPSTIVELRERRRAEHSAINQKGQPNTGFNRSRATNKPQVRRGLPSLVSPSVTSQVELGESETSSDAPFGSLSAE